MLKGKKCFSDLRLSLARILRQNRTSVCAGPGRLPCLLGDKSPFFVLRRVRIVYFWTELEVLNSPAIHG